MTAAADRPDVAHPESRWTHPICIECWDRAHPDREPHRLIGDERVTDRCCWCGQLTKSGIYVRADPSVLLCMRRDR